MPDEQSVQPQPNRTYKPQRPFQKRGLLIAGEGLDGCGKTTLMVQLKEHLAQQGQASLISNWNDTTEIYNLMMRLNAAGDLTNDMRCIFGAVELAARYHYLIRPALHAGTLVIANKYRVSALAHALIRGHSEEFLQRLYDFALPADLTIYLDISPQVALARKLQAGGIGFWEAGLDLALDLPLEVALERYRRGAIPAQFMADSFVHFQTRLGQIHRQLLGDQAVLVLDGNLPPATLFALVNAAVDKLVATQSEGLPTGQVLDEQAA